MGMIIVCACGTAIRASCKQELLDRARSHIRQQHPAVGEPPKDEDLIAMAADEPDGSPLGRGSRDRRGAPA